MSSRDQDWRLDNLCPDRLPAALLLALGDSASEPNGIARVSGLATASRQTSLQVALCLCWDYLCIASSLQKGPLVYFLLAGNHTSLHLTTESCSLLQTTSEQLASEAPAC